MPGDVTLRVLQGPDLMPRCGTHRDVIGRPAGPGKPRVACCPDDPSVCPSVCRPLTKELRMAWKRGLPPALLFRALLLLAAVLAPLPNLAPTALAQSGEGVAVDLEQIGRASCRERVCQSV